MRRSFNAHSQAVHYLQTKPTKVIDHMHSISTTPAVDLVDLNITLGSIACDWLWEPSTIAAEPSLSLHQACCRRNVTVAEIETLTRREPLALSTSLTTYSTKSVYQPSKHACVRRTLRNRYTFPLTLAIQHGICRKIVQLLLEATPREALMALDGPLHESMLHVLLRYRPRDVEMVQTFVSLQPQCVSIQDDCGNTPLHIAARFGSSALIVQQLLLVDGRAKTVCNRQGQTPLDVAMHSAQCEESVTELLQVDDQLEAL